MNTVIIDNDLAAINNLEVILEEIGLTNLTGKYTCGEEAEAEILKQRPHLIILEVDLIKQDGLSLAKRIEKEIEDVKIIFVASDKKYAVEAFEFNQVDFILKPFEQDRVTRALTKLRANYLKLNTDVTKLISCFKNFHYTNLSEDNVFQQIDLKWRTKYAKEIFAYLITYRNANVRKDVLIEMFWPDVGIKKAAHNLYTNIYFIRKMLDEAGLPILINNYQDHYSLDLEDVKLDFEFWLEEVEKYRGVNLSKLERTMNFYQGHYLEEERYLWAEYKMQKLRFIWLETMEYIIDEYVKAGNIHRAIINALYLQKLEPYLEKAYYILMDLFAQIKDYGSIKKQYGELEKMLAEEYDLKPEKELKHFLNNHTA